MAKRGAETGKKRKRGVSERDRRSAAPAARLGLAAALVALAVAPYVAAFSHPLLHDDRTLLDNPWLAREAAVREIFTHDYWFGTRHEGSDLYRPVTVLTLARNLRTATGPRTFRALNAGLHAATTLLVAVTLALVFRRLSPDGPGGESGETAIAWIGAALFAVHPLASETVLFAFGRAELLAALFGLAAFALLIGVESRPAWTVPGSALLLALALGSKESAVAWPVILAAWWGIGRLFGHPVRRAGPGVAAWLAVLVVFLLARGAVVGWAPHPPPWIDNPLALEGAPTRIANAVVLLAGYAGKMLFPLKLSVDYGFDQVRVLPLFPWAVPAAAAVVAAWLAVAAAVRRRSAGALFLWCFVPAAFAITCNVVVPIGTIFGERLAYLPLAGCCGFVAWALVSFVRSRLAVGVIVAVLIAVGGLRTVDRGRDLRDHATFVEATAAASPRAVKALVNAGRARLRAGDAEGAVAPLREAVELWPDYVRALELSADAYEATGRTAEAEADRRRALEARARREAGDAWTPADR